MSAAVYLPLVQSEKAGSDQLSKENENILHREVNRVGRIWEE
jgi:hypothetical protein